MMKKTYVKSIIRSVKGTFSRFIAIFAITALGVGFLAGLLSTTPDMRRTIDNYYDEHDMMDIFIKSTYGFNDDDIAAVGAVEGVEAVMPHYVTDSLADHDGDALVARIYGLDFDDLTIGKMELTEGRYPEKPNEILAEKGNGMFVSLELGDKIALIPDEGAELSDTYTETELTVVGIAVNPYYMSIERENSTKGNGRVGVMVYATEELYSLEVYTDLFVTVSGAKELDTYSDKYWDLIDSVTAPLENVADVRAVERLDEIKVDALAEVEDAEAEYLEKRADAEAELADAEQKLIDAEAEIADGRSELLDGRATLGEKRAELEDGIKQLADAKTEIEENRKKLDDAAAEIADGKAQLDSASAQLAEKEAELEESRTQLESAWAQLTSAEAELTTNESAMNENKALLASKRTELENGEQQLEAARAQLEASAAFLPEEQYAAAKAQLDAQAEQLAAGRAELEAAEAQLAAAEAQLSAGRNELASNRALLEANQAQFDSGAEQLASARAEINAKYAELADGERELNDGRRKLAEAEKTVAENEATLADGKRELAEAEAELADAEQELLDGEVELADARAEYEDKKAEAEAEFADAERELAEAREEIDTLEAPEWYVLDRNSNVSFVSFDSNAEKIAAIAKVFPLFFFLVAALVALTTMTRMIEEERTQIGILKALGYSRGAIMAKYIIYAGVSGLLGSACGLAVGLIVFPMVIWNAYKIMYTFPPLMISFFPEISLISAAVAIACTLAATVWAGAHILSEKPATLLLPRAPKAGKRVLLEHITPIWKRLSFNQKVTIRNLFRYKKRFFMTVIGIAGCTALLVTGFGLRDSIGDIVNKQYDELMQYNLSIVKSDSDEDAELLDAYLASDKVDEWLAIHSEAGYARANGEEVGIYITIPEETDKLTDFMLLRERRSKKEVSFGEDSVVLTEKMASIIGVSVGDRVELENADGKTAQFTVSGITENYVMSYVYMPRGIYESAYGAEPEFTTLYVRSNVSGSAEEDAAVTELLSMKSVNSASFTTSMSSSFANMLEKIDYIIIVLIISAGLLVFVVLYNLTNINIAEREKELATIKVLGFFDGEVAAYVYRETAALSVIGTAVGLILGIFLHRFVVITAEVDIVMFGRDIYAQSYLFASIITLIFSALVCLFMVKKLNNIDMVESMKAGE